MRGPGAGPGRVLDRVLLGSTLGLLAVGLNRAAGPDRYRWLVGAQAVAGWALLPAHLVLPLAAARRRPVLALLAAGLAAYQLGLTRSGRGRARPATPWAGTPVHLVSANLLTSNGTVGAAGRRLLAAPVDVLALLELTPEHLAVLEEDGLLDRLPHALAAPAEGFHGAGLFSRWPLSEAGVLDLDGVPLPVAVVATPDGPLRVAAVHAKNPGSAGQLRRWQHQLVELGALASRSAVPVVLVGDFNATADHRAFRRLLGGGLRDAWDVVGRGSGASWPVWRGPVPALMRLDHALVDARVAVVSAAASDTPGSDHRHLRVELRLPPA